VLRRSPRRVDARVVFGEAGRRAAFTPLITVGGGITERLFDRQEFPTVSKGLWFAPQTVTTVGYGDVTPRRVDGRIIAAVVMLCGIGFIAVITASVTAGLIDSSRRRIAESERDLARRLEDVRERLVRIEAASISGGRRRGCWSRVRVRAQTADARGASAKGRGKAEAAVNDVEIARVAQHVIRRAGEPQVSASGRSGPPVRRALSRWRGSG